MKHREVAAMSKLQNFTSWKEVNKTITHGKHFQMICQKSEQHDPTQPKLSVYSWRFYGDDKILKRRFQTSFYSEYPWIEYSIKHDAPVRFSPFFLVLIKRLKKLSTMYNGSQIQLVFFCSGINWM